MYSIEERSQLVLLGILLLLVALQQALFELLRAVAVGPESGLERSVVLERLQGAGFRGAPPTRGSSRSGSFAPSAALASGAESEIRTLAGRVGRRAAVCLRRPAGRCMTAPFPPPTCRPLPRQSPWLRIPHRHGATKGLRCALKKNARKRLERAGALPA